MTEHDGVRTESATEELRRMLDERGVEWTAPNSILRDDMTSWVANGFDYDAFEVPDGTLVLSAAHQDDLTPEQAIAATLGSEPDDAAMLRLHERMNAALLEYERAQGIEKRDGDGEVVVPFVAEMHRLIEEAATLGAGTCKRVFYEPTGVYVCSECGRGLSKKLDKYCYLHYCPNCGRRVVE